MCVAPHEQNTDHTELKCARIYIYVYMEREGERVCVNGREREQTKKRKSNEKEKVKGQYGIEYKQETERAELGNYDIHWVSN